MLFGMCNCCNCRAVLSDSFWSLERTKQNLLLICFHSWMESQLIYLKKRIGSYIIIIIIFKFYLLYFLDICEQDWLRNYKNLCDLQADFFICIYVSVIDLLLYKCVVGVSFGISKQITWFIEITVLPPSIYVWVFLTTNPKNTLDFINICIINR